MSVSMNGHITLGGTADEIGTGLAEKLLFPLMAEMREHMTPDQFLRVWEGLIISLAAGLTTDMGAQQAEAIFTTTLAIVAKFGTAGSASPAVMH